MALLYLLNVISLMIRNKIKVFDAKKLCLLSLKIKKHFLMIVDIQGGDSSMEK